LVSALGWARFFIGIAGMLLGAFGYHFFGHTWIVVVAVFASVTTIQFFMPYIGADHKRRQLSLSFPGTVCLNATHRDES
jgi:hypothetical protein